MVAGRFFCRGALARGINGIEPPFPVVCWGGARGHLNPRRKSPPMTRGCQRCVPAAAQPCTSVGRVRWGELDAGRSGGDADPIGLELDVVLENHKRRAVV